MHGTHKLGFLTLNWGFWYFVKVIYVHTLVPIFVLGFRFQILGLLQGDLVTITISSVERLTIEIVLWWIGLSLFKLNSTYIVTLVVITPQVMSFGRIIWIRGLLLLLVHLLIFWIWALLFHLILRWFFFYDFINLSIELTQILPIRW